MLIDVLKSIPDHRDPQGRAYQLWEIWFISIIAVMNNAKTYTDIATFIEENFDIFKEHLKVKWRRPPTISAIWKIIVGTDPEEVERAFREHAEGLESKTNNTSEFKKHICFDGKKLNGSFSHAKDKRAQELFNIFGAQENLILGHVDIADKDSEIPTLEKLFAALGLEGIVVTADAIHCQKNI